VKKRTKIATILFITILGMFVTRAQDSEDLGSIDFSYSLLIPKLNVVIESVLKHNAMLNFRKKHIGVQQSVLKSEKLYWTRNFGIQGDTRYGTINNFSTITGNTSTIDLATNQIQLNYGIGLYLKLPIFDVVNRKNQIRLAELEVDEAVEMAKFQKQEIIQTVIRIYNDLLLKRKLLEIRSRRLGDGRVNMQMVEKEFRNGVVPLSEYVRITGITIDMEADYETAMFEFISAKQSLEYMAGFAFDFKSTN
tara:strand:- start:24019 stop:24768 length:750 start_codon:yes stop_codon:yes gene_type:complete